MYNVRCIECVQCTDVRNSNVSFTEHNQNKRGFPLNVFHAQFKAVNMFIYIYIYNISCVYICIGRVYDIT